MTRILVELIYLFLFYYLNLLNIFLQKEEAERMEREEKEKKEAEQMKEKLKEEAENFKKVEISRLQSILPDEPAQDKNVCFYLFCIYSG